MGINQARWHRQSRPLARSTAVQNYGTASPFSSQAWAAATIESSSNGRHKQRSSWSLTLASLPQALLRLCRLVPSGRLHARFSTRLVRGSPYTRSKYRSNHCLYRDTMPLTGQNQWALVKHQLWLTACHILTLNCIPFVQVQCRHLTRPSSSSCEVEYF